MRRRHPILLCLGLAACVPLLARAQTPSRQAPPAAQPAPVDDPFEPVNRVLFKLDREFNRLVGKHNVLGGAGFLPRGMRTPLYNFFNNLDEPANVANDLLQQKWKRGVVASSRFATNSTVGLLGTVDVASRIGLPRHREDFGQTLGKYGVKPGPYIFVPLTGPTSLRDAAGDQVDGLAQPLHWVDMDTPARKGIWLTHHIVQPHIIGIREQARRAAASGQTHDEYATLRQMYFDQRQAEIEDRPGSGDYTLPIPPRPARGVRPVDISARDRSPADWSVRPVDVAALPPASKRTAPRAAAPGVASWQVRPVEMAALPPARQAQAAAYWGVRPIGTAPLPPVRDRAARAREQAMRDAG